VLLAIALAWGLTLVAGCARHPSPSALTPPKAFSFGIIPNPIYQLWLVQVQACALSAAQFDSSFWIERRLDSIEEIQWRAVPTESLDATFLSSLGYVRGMRTGPAGADTIFLSGQLLGSERLVKHELLHVIVASPAESTSITHGRPWGLCEYL
jgi:hypothetical protein